MTLFRRTPPADPIPTISQEEKTRHEADLRWWSEKARAVSRVAELQSRDKG